MAGKPQPANCFLKQQQHFGVRGGDRVWRNKEGDRYYTWDDLHGEIEVFNKRGRHLGVLDAVTGVLIKDPVKGRTITI